MWRRIVRWLDDLKGLSELEYRQARIFQYILLTWIGFGTLGFFVLTGSRLGNSGGLTRLTQLFSILQLVSEVLLWICPMAALVVLRRGMFYQSVSVATLGFLCSHGLNTLLIGTVGGATLLLYQMPNLIAGQLGSRRLLWTVAGLSICIGIFAGSLQGLQSAPMANPGGPPPGAMNNAGSGLQIAFFVVITLVIAICFDQFGSTTRESITSMLSTQAELEHTRDSLEVAVGERTAELQEALDATRAQAAEQARLLEENKAQRLIIRDLSVPALPVSEHILVMPLVGTLDEQRLQMVQEQSLRSITQSRAKYLLLDITGVPIVDTQIAQGLMATVASAKLLGAEAVLVGIRPEVAQTIVSIGIRLEGVRTFSTLYSAISHVEQIRAHGHTKK